MAKSKKKSAPPAEPPLRLEYRRPSELADNPANWRRHPANQLAALSDVLAEVGWAGVLLYNERTERLIDGHARKGIAAKTDEPVPVVIGSWSEEQEAKILATLDPVASLAEADSQALESLLAGVHTDSEAIGQMLDDLRTAAGLGDERPAAGGGGDEFDPTPEQQGPTRTRPGELWVIGGKHRLLVGDCTVPENVARLMGGAKAHGIHADPPYGVNFQRGQFIADPSRPTAAARGVGDSIAGDTRKGQDQHDFIREVFRVATEHLQPGAFVYMWSATLQPGAHSMLGLSAAGVHIQSQLVWVKNNLVLGQCDYQWKHEPCWYGWYDNGKHCWFGERDKTTILEFARVQSTEHPNEKPVAMVEYLLGNSTEAGALVYDPFLGSGTTLVAAHRLGRVCYGCELEPRYADVILKRAEAEGLECVRDG